MIKLFERIKCYTCNSLHHLKCDHYADNEERLYCIACKPAESDFILNSLDPLVSDFINKKGMKFLHQNVNGVSRKIDRIKSFLSETRNCIHILSLSETHTNSAVLDSELEIPGYLLERKERKIGKHGGVSIYIRDDLQFTRREDLEVDDIELLWIEVFIPNSKSLLICSAYRPPDSSKYLDKNFAEKLDDLLSTVTSENKESIMCGDFNIDFNVSTDHLKIKELIKSYGFHQKIKLPTRISKHSRTLIDLAFTTDKTKIAETIVYSNSLSDHNLIGVIRKMHCNRYTPKSITVRDYSKYDKEAVKNELREIPWENCLATVNVNDAWNLFKRYIKLVINKHAPLKDRKVRGKENPWLTREIKRLMHTRDFFLRRFKKTNAERDWSNYKRLRNIVTNQIRTAKANNVRKVLRETSNHPRDFWKHIKKCYPSKGSSCSSKTFNINDTLVFDKKIIANAFCSFFTRVGSSLMKSSTFVNLTWKSFNVRRYLSTINPGNSRFSFAPVTIYDIVKVLKSIKSSKASGMDKIPASILKDAAEELAAPLMFLINRSLQSGTFPSCEKMAKVTPLFKAGGRSNIDNYRPISVLNILSKVVERVVYNQLTTYLENNNLLSEHQYGFRQNRSTRDAVTRLADNIRKNMDDGKLTGALFMDLRKAFDTVNHGCLLQKLPYYGIFGTELEWIGSYLFQRSQAVFFDGILSETEFITHGVPQGSILGPLLFVLLINDLPLQLKHCRVLMYADDTVIYYSNKSIPVIEEYVNSDATRVQQWMKENCLILNPKKGKTEFVIFATKKTYQQPASIKIENNVINQPESYDYLGIKLDSHLNLNSHFQSVYKRIRSRINLLRKIRFKISPSVADTIFTAMVHPLFFYCYPLYCGMNKTWLQKFESLLARAKVVVNSPKSLSWATIENQRKRKMAIDVFKAVNGMTDNHEGYELLDHSIRTRSCGNKLRLPKIRTEAGRKVSHYQGALIFNSLDTNIRTEKSYVNFKNLLKNFDF